MAVSKKHYRLSWLLGIVCVRVFTGRNTQVVKPNNKSYHDYIFFEQKDLIFRKF